MNKSLLSAALAVTALTATSANAAPVGLVGQTVTAHATIVKPLTLTKMSDMDFGSIIVQDNGTITMDTAGNITCPATLTCSATGTPAGYKVTGTNNQTVQVNAPNVTLLNVGNPGTPLTLVLSAPATVLLPNSGASGTTFNVGGSMAIAASTKDGTYAGDLAVTVNY